MNGTDNVERHKKLCQILNEIYSKKNHDYGDSFHQSFLEEGLTMARIRLGDKFNRFKTLSKNGEAAVNDESIRDTLLDLANYAIMTVMEIDLAKPEKKIWRKGCDNLGDLINRASFWLLAHIKQLCFVIMILSALLAAGISIILVWAIFVLFIGLPPGG